eukprot:CAMPEP_0181087108 /NCGR_PEP_ID=MMETSP1071-20121207/6100_1 /TAXON_ID=35127 /ORGANISM="Thalassiosira sp., Strain NH16" /LENGTH=93 /DNA_ID=CAMNT_0023168981 /DNA_START=42 /DNA_END=320 /DNA_ORIENTATION=+
MLCRSDQVEAPISSRVGGQATRPSRVFPRGVADSGDDDCASSSFPPPTDRTPCTRCSAAERADFVSSHAGRSQSSPPPIDLNKDANESSLLLP